MLRLFLTRCYVREASVLNQFKPGKTKWNGFWNTLSPIIGSHWWRTDGIRVEKFPRILYTGSFQWDSKDDGRIKVWTWATSRKYHLHVHVQWYLTENSRNWRKSCSEFRGRSNTRQKVSIRMLVISGTWFWEKSGVELSSTSQMLNGIQLLRTWWSISLKAGIQNFESPVLWKEENWKVKVVERKPFTTTGVKKPLNWFFARLFQSISSVSTEQSQICATTQIQIKPKVWSANLWWYRQRVPTLTPHLRVQHHQHRETCCKIISRNSQNYLKIRNFRNFAKMLVS